MKHLIITRYNIPMKGYAELDTAWYEKRLHLMRTYTQPSMREQTCRAFAWLVLCDPATPAERKAELAVTFPDAIMVYERYQVAVERLAPAGTDLITTRCDSDDMLGPEYVERVQRLSEVGSVYSFGAGYKLDERTGRLYASEMLNSPFQSYREITGDDTKTIYGLGNHTHVHEKYPTLHDGSYRGWCEIIHDGNICNRIKPRDRATEKSCWVTERM